MMVMTVVKCLTRFADEIPTISRAANIQTHLVIKAKLMIPGDDDDDDGDDYMAMMMMTTITTMMMLIIWR